MLVMPSTTTEAPSRHRSPMVTSGPITQCGPTIDPAADSGARMHDRGGMHRRGAGIDGQQQRGLGDDVAADVGRGLHDCQPRARPLKRQLEPELVAGHDAAPELPAGDATQRHPGRRQAAVLEHQGRGGLGQRLDLQDRGHERQPGKMALEELLVDRDLLDGDQTATRLVATTASTRRAGWR